MKLTGINMAIIYSLSQPFGCNSDNLVIIFFIFFLGWNCAVQVLSPQSGHRRSSYQGNKDIVQKFMLILIVRYPCLNIWIAISASDLFENADPGPKFPPKREHWGSGYRGNKVKFQSLCTQQCCGSAFKIENPDPYFFFTKFSFGIFFTPHFSQL